MILESLKNIQLLRLIWRQKWRLRKKSRKIGFWATRSGAGWKVENLACVRLKSVNGQPNFSLKIPFSVKLSFLIGSRNSKLMAFQAALGKRKSVCLYTSKSIQKFIQNSGFLSQSLHATENQWRNKEITMKTQVRYSSLKIREFFSSDFSFLYPQIAFYCGCCSTLDWV